MRRGITAAVGLGIGLLLWSRLFHATPEIEVTRLAVSEGPIVREVVAEGTVEPVTMVQVGVQVSGSIQSLEADFNSIVHAGDVLARLDPSLFQAALDGARAEWQQAVAQAAQLQAPLDEAELQLGRAERLAAQELMTQSDLDVARTAVGTARADREAARARVSGARAALDQAQLNLRLTVIRSPIDGVVISRNVDRGQTVASTLQAPTLFAIASNFDRLRVEAQVDEADIGGVRVGEPATLRVPSYPDETFEGTIAEIRFPQAAEPSRSDAGSSLPGSSSPAATRPATSPTATTNVSYPTIIDVMNPEEKLRPGMTPLVILAGARRDHAVRVPNNALLFRPSPKAFEAVHQPEPALRRTTPGGQRLGHVWEFDGAAFTPIPVLTGLSDNDFTEVLEGALHAGDLVVTGASTGN